MGYKAVINDPSYLCHFNKNHDPKNGRFTFKKAWETIDKAVGNGYDAVEKVAKGAYRGIKKEFNSPSGKDFDGDKVEIPNSSITKSTNPNDYRSPDLDKDYSELEKSGVFTVGKLKRLYNSDDANEIWGKDMVSAMDVGLKALAKTRYATGDSDIEDFADGNVDESHKNALRSWFVFEDQTYGMPEAAYLVNAGWPKDKVLKAFKSAYEQESKNNEFSEAYLASKKAESLSQPDLFIKLDETRNLEPYKNVWPLSEGYANSKNELEEYVDACVDVVNESKAQHSIDMSEDSLTHYNKNHSKANGQFISGDGDSDGVVDDHHNYKKNKVTNPDGTNIKTTIKNPGSNGKNLYKYLKKNKLKYRYSLDVGSLEDRRNRYKTISEDFGISDAIKDKKLTKSYTNYINSIAKAQKIDKEATDAALKGDMATYRKLEQKAQKAGDKASGLGKKYDEDVSRVAEEIIGKYSNKKLSKEYKYSEAVEQIINAVIYEHI